MEKAISHPSPEDTEKAFRLEQLRDRREGLERQKQEIEHMLDSVDTQISELTD